MSDASQRALHRPRTRCGSSPRQPVRRARRRHQHHAADPAVAGREVIHLGHNRSVDEVVTAAVAGGRAGRGRSLLPGRPRRVLPVPRRAARASEGAGHVRVYGGGGGVIVPEEIDALAALRRHESSRRRTGSASASPADDQHDRRRLRRRSGRDRWPSTRRRARRRPPRPRPGHHRPRGRRHAPMPLDAAAGAAAARRRRRCSASPAPAAPASRRSPTSWSAASASTRRTSCRIAVLAVDPTRRRGGGALLGDRIRMNAVDAAAGVLPLARHPRVGSEVPEALDDVHRRVRAAGFDLVIVETPGIGQGDAGDRRPRRRVALRDDARVRCRQPAREDRHARLRRRRRHQQVRAPRRRGRPARRAPPAGPQPGAVRRRPARRCRCSAPSPPASTTTASPRSTSTCGPCSPSGACRSTRAPLPAVDGAVDSTVRDDRARRRARATSPRSPRPCAATTHDRRAGAPLRPARAAPRVRAR